MSRSSSEVGLYEAAWNQLLIDLRRHFDMAVDYVNTLSEAEKLMGVGIFVAVFLIMLLMLAATKNSHSGGNGRQFSGALFVVIVVAFGVGWTWDTSSGSLAHLFGR
ncbi:MAG: hypothetical protein QNI84_08320 [Henriciella sp.]|nr:hypothetical protein [Henriciella sp.]